MSALIFQRLVLISDSKKQANQFEFLKRVNLVTGNDNSIGKSTLVKSLLWSMGCEPQFDEEWKSNDVKTITYFTVNGVKYIISRYKNTILLGKKLGKLRKFTSISGEFAEEFASIVSFNCKLENRQEELEQLPPTYYFLPFYIDQLKSWSEPWNSFERLQQFTNFKQPLIKYFCGYLKPEYFEVQEQISEEKSVQKEVKKSIERITNAKEVLAETSESTVIALSKDELEKIQIEIEIELNSHSELQTQIFEKQTVLRTEIYDLEQQLKLSILAANALEKDYVFAVENVAEDALECPLCGVEHDNSLINRAGLLKDKESLEVQSEVIQKELHIKKVELDDLGLQLNFVESEIDRINKKYLIDEQENESDTKFNQALSSLAQKNIDTQINMSLQSKELAVASSKSIEKDLKKQRDKLLTKLEREELNEMFMGNLLENIQTLGAEGINLSKVKSPTDYKKLLGGGAAEGTRGLLAYQLAVLKQIADVDQCSIAPFIIDTPNQHEQAGHRYENILKVIKLFIPQSFQIILCGMEHSALDSIRGEAHEIKLNGSRLLDKLHYKELKHEYDSLDTSLPLSES